MSLFKHAIERDRLNQVQQKRYNKITFPCGFVKVLESLHLAGYGNSNIKSIREGSSYVWMNDCASGGVRLETDSHPLISEYTNMTVYGDKGALEIIDWVLNNQSVIYEGSTSPIPHITHEYHDELMPDLWERDGESYTLRSDVKEALMDIAAEFVEFQKMIDLEIEDIILTGSCANFNWTPSSDVDLHLLVNFKNTIKQYGPLVPEYFEAKRKVWSDLHSITVKGLPVEPYMQNTAEKHHSTAIYSLTSDTWLIEPNHRPPSIDNAEIKAKLKTLMSTIDDAISSNKADVIENLMDKIKKLRKDGLESGGEWSAGNLVFKTLRNNGYLEKLYTCKNKIYDRALSIEDEEWSYYR